MKKVVYQPWYADKRGVFGFAIFRNMDSCDSFNNGWMVSQTNIGNDWCNGPGMKLFTFIPNEWYARLFEDTLRYTSVSIHWHQITPRDVHDFLLQKCRIRLLRSITEIEEERYERRT